MTTDQLPRFRRRLARLNRVGLNRLTIAIAPWAPGWAVVVHRGRKSGRTYRTPLWVFRKRGHADEFVIALTYGRTTQWLRNVLAAGGCELESRGRRYHVANPRVYTDPTRADMPRLIRGALRILNVEDFLALTVESSEPLRRSDRAR